MKTGIQSSSSGAKEGSPLLSSGGLSMLMLQPRSRGSMSKDARRAAEHMAGSLRSAGFKIVRSEILRMAPVDAACVFGGKEPGAEQHP